MTKKFQTILFLLALSVDSLGQGKKLNGLKIGKWTEKHFAYYNYSLTGNYKIIPLSKYDTIRTLGNNTYEIKYKNSTALMFFDGIKNGNISVKDNIWNSFDTTGNLRRISYWIEGLNQWTKYFDEKGNLVQHDYRDYEHDTSFQLSYINGRFFKKAFSLQKTKIVKQIYTTQKII